jgi:hypothetical protein
MLERHVASLADENGQLKDRTRDLQFQYDTLHEQHTVRFQYIYIYIRSTCLNPSVVVHSNEIDIHLDLEDTILSMYACRASMKSMRRCNASMTS